MRRDGERPETFAKVFSETSAPLPRLSRRYLRTRGLEGESSQIGADSRVLCQPSVRRVAGLAESLVLSASASPALWESVKYYLLFVEQEPNPIRSLDQ